MASSEEQLQCSICLDVFAEPVTTPCGHNFCKACIRGYWDSTDVCMCPTCKNTAAQVKELAPVHVTLITPGQAQTTTLNKSGEVPCDICTETKHMALKSCLVCLTSYCEAHLEHHRIVASLKKHKLIDPVENLEDRVCKKHERPLELFCKRDQACVCQFCTETDHKTHKTVPIEEEYGERKAQMGKSKDTFQKMIQERLKKVKEIEQAQERRRERDSRQFAGLRCSGSFHYQAELIEVVEEKQKAAERQAERLIEELEQEITELKSRSTELEQLSDIKDHLHLLQSSTSLYTTLPPTKNWSEISVHSDLCVGTVRRAVSQLEETLNKEMEMFPQIKLKRMQQCAVDVTLDPDTACPYLILSEDRKEVRYGAIKQELPDNPGRFDCHPRVLGMEGFSSGKFYYEVQVKEKTWWALGVARESINRKGMNVLSPEFGAWTIELRNRTEYGARTELVVPLNMREKPQKVGVFVDYKKGQVSFYNVEARSHIYSFTDCTFIERLYPLLSSPDPSGDNSAPLIFSPVMSEFSQ
ncbi:unnamed protein product [Oncorhynchus mykiss]|uniref:Uncharacterized protein n=1 Tax=Oncorhynchus mykiss TaxID=8022 RepID=A0A060XG13_ONCMY|nr:unnamed protein product [Oncorhynchus mykiss]